MTSTRRLVVALLASGALAACSGDDGTAVPTTPPTTATPTTDPPTTDPPTTDPPTTTATPTTSPQIDPAAFTEPGPYPVGVTTLTLPKGALVEVWYPAAVPASGTITYDIREYVPPEVRALLTADVPAGASYPGSRDVPLAAGTFPVVLFSHGYSGVRVQSTFLTSHLASYGMIVAAPEHASRDLTNNLAQTASGDAADAVDDVLRTLELLTAEGARPGGAFDGHVDTERVAIAGHSAGGFTAVVAARDPRIDGYVSMASGGPPPGEPFPDVPSLFLAGTIDGVVPVDSVTRPAFDAAASPSWFVEIADTGHNGFDDFCTFGNGTGIIGIAEASGLGPVLDAQPQLRTLGQDGCIPPAAPVAESFPVTLHAVTSFLRFVFADDAQPMLGPELDDAYQPAVTTASH